MYLNVCFVIIVPCLVNTNIIGLFNISKALYVTYLESVQLGI